MLLKKSDFDREARRIQSGTKASSGNADFERIRGNRRKRRTNPAAGTDTTRGMLARISRYTDELGADSEEVRNLASAFEQELSTPGSKYYNAYYTPTSKAVSELKNLGIEVPDAPDEQWLTDAGAYVAQYQRNTATGVTAAAPTTKSTVEQNTAYWLSRYLDDYDTTQSAQNEALAVQRELGYWIQKGYSDEQAIGKVDMSQYATLSKMAEKQSVGEATQLTQALPFGEDLLYTWCWQARNPDMATGDTMTDMALSGMGEGNAYRPDADSEAARDPANYEAYHPYRNGSTMDGIAMQYGVSSWDGEWLDAHRDMLRDEDTAEDWRKMYSAWENTQAARQELEKLNTRVDELVRDGNMTYDALMQVLDFENNYPTLAKMEDYRAKGAAMELSDSVDFSMPYFEMAVREKVAEAAEAIETPEVEAPAIAEEAAAEDMPAEDLPKADLKGFEEALLARQKTGLTITADAITPETLDAINSAGAANLTREQAVENINAAILSDDPDAIARALRGEEAIVAKAPSDPREGTKLAGKLAEQAEPEWTRKTLQPATVEALQVVYSDAVGKLGTNQAVDPKLFTPEVVATVNATTGSNYDEESLRKFVNQAVVTGNTDALTLLRAENLTAANPAEVDAVVRAQDAKDALKEPSREGSRMAEEMERVESAGRAAQAPAQEPEAEPTAEAPVNDWSWEDYREREARMAPGDFARYNVDMRNGIAEYLQTGETDNAAAKSFLKTHGTLFEGETYVDSMTGEGGDVRAQKYGQTIADALDAIDLRYVSPDEYIRMIFQIAADYDTARATEPTEEIREAIEADEIYQQAVEEGLVSGDNALTDDAVNAMKLDAFYEANPDRLRTVTALADLSRQRAQEAEEQRAQDAQAAAERQLAEREEYVSTMSASGIAAFRAVKDGSATEDTKQFATALRAYCTDEARGNDAAYMEIYTQTRDVAMRKLGIGTGENIDVGMVSDLDSYHAAESILFMAMNDVDEQLGIAQVCNMTLAEFYERYPDQRIDPEKAVQAAQDEFNQTWNRFGDDLEAMSQASEEILAREVSEDEEAVRLLAEANGETPGEGVGFGRAVGEGVKQGANQWVYKLADMMDFYVYTGVEALGENETYLRSYYTRGELYAELNEAIAGTEDEKLRAAYQQQLDASVDIYNANLDPEAIRHRNYMAGLKKNIEDSQEFIAKNGTRAEQIVASATAGLTDTALTLASVSAANAATGGALSTTTAILGWGLPASTDLARETYERTGNYRAAQAAGAGYAAIDGIINSATSKNLLPKFAGGVGVSDELAAAAIKSGATRLMITNPTAAQRMLNALLYGAGAAAGVFVQEGLEEVGERIIMENYSALINVACGGEFDPDFTGLISDDFFQGGLQGMLLGGAGAAVDAATDRLTGTTKANRFSQAQVEAAAVEYLAAKNTTDAIANGALAPIVNGDLHTAQVQAEADLSNTRAIVADAQVTVAESARLQEEHEAALMNNPTEETLALYEGATQALEAAQKDLERAQGALPGKEAALLQAQTALNDAVNAELAKIRQSAQQAAVEALRGKNEQAVVKGVRIDGLDAAKRKLAVLDPKSEAYGVLSAQIQSLEADNALETFRRNNEATLAKAGTKRGDAAQTRLEALKADSDAARANLERIANPEYNARRALDDALKAYTGDDSVSAVIGKHGLKVAQQGVKLAEAQNAYRDTQNALRDATADSDIEALVTADAAAAAALGDAQTMYDAGREELRQVVTDAVAETLAKSGNDAVQAVADAVKTGDRAQVEAALADIADADGGLRMRLDGTDKKLYNNGGGEFHDSEGIHREGVPGAPMAEGEGQGSGEALGRRNRESGLSDRVPAGWGHSGADSEGGHHRPVSYQSRTGMAEASAEQFSGALEDAKASRPDGYQVDSHTAEEIKENQTRTFLKDDGKSGFAVEKNGNITGVFKHGDLDGEAGKGVVTDMMLLAVDSGGDRLDCYAGDLFNESLPEKKRVGKLPKIYARYGFKPVAVVRYNPEYAASTNVQDIVVFAHNGKTAAEIEADRANNIYERVTLETLLALPVMEYDDALRYRDSLLDGAPKQNSVSEIADRLLSGDAGAVRAAQELASGADGIQAKRGGTALHPGKSGVKSDAPSGRIRNPVQIARSLLNALGVGDYIGSPNSKRAGRNEKVPDAAQGYYVKRAGAVVTDTRHAADFATTLHEAGHALSEMLGLDATDDMVERLPDEVKRAYPEAEWRGEAFADFVFDYMLNGRDHAIQNAGRAFVAEFERAMQDKGVLDAVQEHAAAAREYAKADVEGKVRAHIVSERGGKSREGFFTRLISGMVDRTHAASRLDKAAGSTDGMTIRQQLRYRTFRERAAMKNLTEAATDADGNIAGLSLAKTLENANIRGSDFDRLTNYMVARHALDLMGREEAVRVLPESVTQEELAAFVAKVERETPNIRSGAEATTAWWNGFMQRWLVDTGLLSQKEFDRMRAVNPHYVPMLRAMTGSAAGGERGSGYKLTFIKGGDAEIQNPFNSYVEMTRQIGQMVAQNEVARAVHRAYRDNPGLGAFLRDVTEYESKRQSAQDKIDELAAANGNPTGDNPFDFVIRGIQKPTSNGNIFSGVDENGKRFAYQVAPGNEALAAVLASSPRTAKTGLDAAGRITRTVSMLITGKNPLFAIRNAIKDFQTSVNYGSWASNYLSGFAKWVRSMVEVAKESEGYREYQAMGGGGYSFLSAGEPRSNREYRGQLFKGNTEDSLPGKLRYGAGKAIHFLTMERLNEIVEQTSRYAEYRFGKHDTSTPEGRQKALLAAQDVTVDFSLGGDSQTYRILKQIVPFFGPTVQGIARTGRMFSKAERDRLAPRLAKTILNNSLRAAAQILILGALGGDDDMEEYNGLDDTYKMKYFYIPVQRYGDEGGMLAIKLPTSEDLLSRAAYSGALGLIGKASDQYSMDVLDTVSGMLWDALPDSTVFSPVLDAYNNRTWTGATLVNQSLATRAAVDQYEGDTAGAFVSLARALYSASGGAVNLSPIKLQYVFEQTSGIVGQLVIPALSTAASPDTSAWDKVFGVLHDVRNQFTTDTTYSNRYSSLFYDGKDKLTEIVKAGDTEGGTSTAINPALTDEERKAAYTQARALTRSGGAYYEATKAIAELYDEIEQNNANPDLTFRQKESLNRAVRERINEEYLAAIAAGEDFFDRYGNDGGPAGAWNVLVHGGIGSQRVLAPTALETLPEVFQEDVANEAGYLVHANEVQEANPTLTSILPSIPDSFTKDKVTYVVTDEIRGAAEREYYNTYSAYATVSDAAWTNMTDEEKLETIQTARRKALTALKNYVVAVTP